MPEGDIPWPSNKLQLVKFERISFEDTKRSFAMDGGTSVREYIWVTHVNFSSTFVLYFTPIV